MKQRGNILFLILLAVVLFAALAYAVTSSMRGGGKDGSAEQSQSGASQILQFFSSIDAGLMRLQLSQDIKQSNISLEYPYLNISGYRSGNAASPYYSNSNCTANTCKLFQTDGGGVVAMTFRKYGIADDYFPTSGGGPSPGYYDYVLVDWPQAGTSANDVVMFLPLIKTAICDELVKMGIPNIPSNHTGGSYRPAYPVSNWDLSAGTFTDTASRNRLIGETTFIKYSTSTGTAGNINMCEIWHLLLAR